MKRITYTLSRAGNVPNAASRNSGTRNSAAADLKHYRAMRFVIERLDGKGQHKPRKAVTGAFDDGAV